MAEGKKTLVDVFVEGARKGWGVAINSMLPNVLLAFVLIEVLNLSGLLKMLGSVCGPIMAIFGLPGEAVTVLLASWLSMGGGVGVAASLYTAKILTNTHVTIVFPAIFLMGAQIQYMGRLLGTAGVQSRYYGMMFGICILNALLAMLVMRFFA